MKKFKKYSGIISLILIVAMSFSTTAFAAVPNDAKPYVNYSIEIDDPTLADAVKISSDSYVENGRLITVDVYRMSDGTIITDTFERSATAAFSSEGRDSATRTRKINTWGTVTLTASFDWYTEGAFSYVRCSSASASHDLDEKAEVSTWKVTRTSNYVSVGKASGQVKYRFYNRTVPVEGISGTLKITCTDTGTISDNA